MLLENEAVLLEEIANSSNAVRKKSPEITKIFGGFLVRPTGLEPAAFRVGELRQGGID